MNCSMPGFLNFTSSQSLLKFMTTESVMLSNHLILLPFSFAFTLLQDQGLFQWVSSLHQVAKLLGDSASASVLPMNIQGWIPLGLTGLISLQSRGLSIVFSSTTIRKHQFFGPQPCEWSNSHIHTWFLEKPQLWLYRPLSAKWSAFFFFFF